MKIKLLAIGKTDDKHLQALIDVYQKRLRHYISFELLTLPDLKNAKNLSEKEQKEKEGLLLLKQINPSDAVYLLDEKGKGFRSVEFANFIQKQMNAGVRQLVFIIGGPYGFSEKVYQTARGSISLSEMTFSHQMIRLLFVEQVYRAFTILKNEPYHHE